MNAGKNATSKTPTIIVEAGVRYGCSARIFLDVLKDQNGWQLHLIDPEPKKEATDLTHKDARIVFHKEKGDVAAGKFADQSIDILHLDVDCDGTHPYELTFYVLLAFWNKLKANAQVIFHDATKAFPGVLRLVNELAESKQWQICHASPRPECPISAPACASKLMVENEHKYTAKTDLTVVIPVIKDKWLESFLSMIQTNTVQPDEIIVIDNGNGVARSICDKFPDLPIRYLLQAGNLGVNGSWNLGMAKAKTSLVSILNDDLIIHNRFFEMILKTFDAFPSAGFVVPQTIMTPQHVRPEGDAPKVVTLLQREGWAFTIKKEFAEPIPESLFTFCGDDWLFQKIKLNGGSPLKIMNNKIFHHIGISQNLEERKTLNLPTFESERNAWRGIQADLQRDTKRQGTRK